MDMLLHWLPTTTIAYYMRGNWEWPAAESLHFIGLSLLIGTVGLFDLRLLGLGRSIALPSLHRLVPWGILGYCINVFYGNLFFSLLLPDLFMFNPFVSAEGFVHGDCRRERPVVLYDDVPQSKAAWSR